MKIFEILHRDQSSSLQSMPGEEPPPYDWVPTAQREREEQQRQEKA